MEASGVDGIMIARGALVKVSCIPLLVDSKADAIFSLGFSLRLRREEIGIFHLERD